MSSTAAQVNTPLTKTQTTTPAQTDCNKHCEQYNSFDPRRGICEADQLLCFGGQVPGDIVNAPSNVANGVTQAMIDLLKTDLMGLVQAPFKALGLNGLSDLLFRLLLVGLGLMSIWFGLMIFAGTAVKEEAGNPQVQQAASAAAAA